MALDPQLPGRNKLWTVGFIAADTTIAKMLVDETPAEIITALAGETAIPGESAVRQQILRGGCRVVAGSIATTDTNNKSLLLYKGSILTRSDNMGAPTITGQNVLNRTIGSYVTDGWRAGDLVFPFNMTTAANNGALGIVTTVTALAITVNGTPFTNETMPVSGARLVRAARLTRRAVPLSSGDTDAVPPVLLVGGTQDPASPPMPDAGWQLGPTDVILAAMVAAVAALPAALTINAETVRY